MKKRTWAAVLLGTAFLCAAGIAAASYTKEKLIEEAVQEAQRQQEDKQGAKCGYILIHTTDGEEWGFYGQIEILSAGAAGEDIDIDMTGWLVGSTHKCFNPDMEENGGGKDGD